MLREGLDVGLGVAAGCWSARVSRALGGRAPRGGGRAGADRGMGGRCAAGLTGTGLRLPRQADRGFILAFPTQCNGPGCPCLRAPDGWGAGPLPAPGRAPSRTVRRSPPTSLVPAAIPLKSELAYEIFDQGQVRFWLQAEHLSPDASYRFIINDREVSDSEVSPRAEGQGPRVTVPCVFSPWAAAPGRGRLHDGRVAAGPRRAWGPAWMVGAAWEPRSLG